ncbi:multidrug effflux MFS transporter [Bradyrhizobium elkanii]|uniref:multidrug effflux MFS transporter n=1 Tax=Bradyrhizobium elkanii TaxID=29448 RepID=UPI00209D6363|nr:multidrug effflux MFS transporter [Bradyrhizobium elkanii]MCP1968556.1 DHA1 family bicyclomycin/chloramphenicol resistance-like MFS transporter [Bradyrhizobium elkanii]MCS4109942.1 DHA1 family bicyclomycin/chloramphenicol resistance-like MFS transporter [Bradyrhizobium elkanii]
MSLERAERQLTGGILFLLAGLSALGALATNIILPAFPRIGASLGVSSRELGLTLSSFFVAFAFGQLLAGPLSDVFGRKWLVLGGLTVFAAGGLLCAFADTLSFLVLGRVIQAFGACTASVLSRAIARDLFDGEALARALALTMIAGAAAPGFSPLLGSALDDLLGWRFSFLIVAAFGIVLALHYLVRVDETHPMNRRAAPAALDVATAYGRLAIDPRFLLPAVSVSLIIGGLYTVFATAPAILMIELGLTAFQLGSSFATTVLVVFAAGFLAPRLAQRFGQHTVGLIGLFFALAGGLSMFVFAARPTFMLFTAAVTLYLLGMGLINPLGSAIALHPFGGQAGLASALLGFLQMGCAALGASFASALPLEPSASLAVILSSHSMFALLVFLPVALRLSK